MSCNDVYMILYSKKARSINKQFEELHKHMSAPAADTNFMSKFGE